MERRYAERPPEPDVQDAGAGRQSGWGAAVKRLIDIVGAALGLALSAPILALCALAILRDDGRPVVYRGTRVGKHGRRFQLYKLRTMGVDTDEALHRTFIANELTTTDHDPDRAAVYKIEDDPRWTRVGSFLRRTSLDELPQLVNVLKGEMSLVGPRPEVEYAIPYYQPHHHRRFRVVPGMTGLWQVSGRSQLTVIEMLELDVEYADRWSIWLDLKILIRTLPAVLLRRGAEA